MIDKKDNLRNTNGALSFTLCRKSILSKQMGPTISKDLNFFLNYLTLKVKNLYLLFDFSMQKYIIYFEISNNVKREHSIFTLVEKMWEL